QFYASAPSAFVRARQCSPTLLQRLLTVIPIGISYSPAELASLRWSRRSKGREVAHASKTEFGLPMTFPMRRSRNSCGHRKFLQCLRSSKVLVSLCKKRFFGVAPVWEVVSEASRN